MEKLKIDKNIPIPCSVKRTECHPYPLENMNPGDSFAVDGDENTRKRVYSLVTNYQNLARNRGKNLKFSTRKISETQFRVWRIS
jgi:hypothetical protein